MTPTAFYCTMKCLFCWRVQSGDLGIEWVETKAPTWDPPEEIVEGCIKAQLQILSGYKGNPKADLKKYSEALSPRHAAISLAGEPTMYPDLGDLISCFHERGFTTFLVSNGTLPEALSNLSEEPTQLYVSVCAYDKRSFLRTCRPQIPNAWERLNETLSLLNSFRCPTVIRITLVKGLNMDRPDLYARLIERTNSTYVEPKAYMHVGMSTLRLKFKNMPTHEEVRKFAVQLANEIGYNIIDESEESRVVLLSRLKEPIKLRS